MPGFTRGIKLQAPVTRRSGKVSWPVPSNFQHLQHTWVGTTATVATAFPVVVNLASAATAYRHHYLYVMAKPYNVNFTIADPAWSKVMQINNGSTASGVNTGSVTIAVFEANGRPGAAELPTAVTVTGTGTPTVIIARILSTALSASNVVGAQQNPGYVNAWTSGVDAVQSTNFSATMADLVGGEASNSEAIGFFAANAEMLGGFAAQAVSATGATFNGNATTNQAASVGDKGYLAAAAPWISRGAPTAAPTLTYISPDVQSGAAIMTRLNLLPSDDVAAVEAEHIERFEDAGFPDVTAEVAPDNDYSESTYAPTGFTDVTAFVESISGKLRGRTYEIGLFETGNIGVTLDNSDFRFTPGSRLSPHFPNIKAGRRFRLRGRNMINPNVATGGRKYGNTIGFAIPSTGASAALPLAIGTHDPWLLPDSIGDTHVEFGVTASATVGPINRMVELYAPTELGTQMAYSAYIWKLSGSTGIDAPVIFYARYYDANGTWISNGVNGINVEDPVRGDRWNNRLVATAIPQRYWFVEQAPGNAKYMRLTCSLDLTQPVVSDTKFAITGIQAEVVPETWNMTPFTASLNFQVKDTGTATDDATGYGVDIAWASGDVEAVTTVERLVPGELYTVYVQATKTGSGPDILISSDDGQTGYLLNNEGAATDCVYSFTAERVVDDIKFIPQGPVTSGHALNVANIRVVRGDRSADPTFTAIDMTVDGLPVTDWQEPKPIFEGWTEDWPSTTGDFSAKVSINVVDRLGKLGTIELDSTLKETLFRDGAQLVLPLDDSSLDAQAKVSNVGTWGTNDGVTSVDITPMAGDLSAASYALGAEGPTDETAMQFNRISTSPARGYFLKVPYSADYANPPGVPVVPTTPKPIPRGKHVYTKKYLATWSQTYNEDNTKRTGQGNRMFHGSCAQSLGTGCVAAGNQFALFGFNTAAILKDLKSADIKYVHLVMENENTWIPALMTTRLGYSTYNAAPVTNNHANNNRSKWSIKNWRRGGVQTIDLGVFFGNMLKAGTAKSMILGGASTIDLDNYGYFYGAASPRKPYLVIQYVK